MKLQYNKIQTNQPTPDCHINLSRGTQDYIFKTKEVPAHGSGIQFQGCHKMQSMDLNGLNVNASHNSNDLYLSHVQNF
jgi:hypothetical protein